MDQKTKKLNYLKWLGLAAILLILVFGALWLSSKAEETPATKVTVLNSVPSDPGESYEVAEVVISSATSPTNEGTSVEIGTTVDDPNGDDWYLYICKSDDTTDCFGGDGSNKWCSSSATESGSYTSCSITTTGISDEENDWYAFSCDSVGCSTGYSQGTKTDGSESPFVVNHAPTFTIGTNVPEPGENLTFTATATDSDVSNIQDSMTLYICKTDSWTASEGCAGGAWCTSNPESGDGSNSVEVACSYTVPSVHPDGDYDSDYYTFLKDNHNFASSSAAQGDATLVTIANVAPAVSGIELNNTTGSGNLNLTVPGGTTEGFTVKFTVTDQNSCKTKDAGDEINALSTLAFAYREGVVYETNASGQDSCNTRNMSNDDSCYAEINCVQDIDSCENNSDATATFTCTFDMEYHADPTWPDSGDTAGPFAGENWLASVIAVDDNDEDSGLTEGSVGNYMNQLQAFVLNSTLGGSALTLIDYGGLSAGTPNTTGILSAFEAQGNTGLIQKLSGSNLIKDADVIPVGSQKYGDSSDFVYDSAGVALTTDSTDAGYCGKPTASALDKNIQKFWKIKVPIDTPAGEYNGTNSVVSAVALTGNW